MIQVFNWAKALGWGGVGIIVSIVLVFIYSIAWHRGKYVETRRYTRRGDDDKSVPS